MQPKEIVQSYLDRNFRLVFWPQIGDNKGPREKDWTSKVYTLADYQPGYRVGAMLGVEVAPGRFLHDVDVDWGEGVEIAHRLLPTTGFIFGRPSKKYSHYFYTLPETVPTFKYEDIDGSSLIEIRGTKKDGELGFETMVPPSEWSKETKREALAFISSNPPNHIETASELKQSVCLTAIGMILAKHLGKNGFGHEPRLAWAGFLLRLGIDEASLTQMGMGMSAYTNNLETNDISTVLQSTAKNLKIKGQKVKGGPALAKLLGDNGKKILARINEWLGRDSDFIRDASGKIAKDSQENIRRALALMGYSLTFDEFARRMLLDRAGQPRIPLEDREVNDIWLRMDDEYRFRPSSEFFEKVIKRLAWANGFHPVKDYLNGLVWDGIPRIDRWLEIYGGVPDNDYVRAVSGIVLVAAVRRIRHPGCKYDEMLVIESGQGLNKSSALRALCPRDDWFSDDLPLNIEARQLIEATLGKWIIEASDLAGKKKTEIEQLKAMLSRQIDGPARMAYAHFPVEQPRQFILVGTTNSLDYLTDPTGARRFWPVEIRRFDLGALIRDRDQLWAEANAREATGVSIRLPEHLWALAGEEQEKRRQVDAWEDDIADFVVNICPSSDGKKRIASNLIWEALGIEKARRDRTAANRIGEIMQRLGFRHTAVRIEGKLVSGYISGQTSGELPFDGQ